MVQSKNSPIFLVSTNATCFLVRFRVKIKDTSTIWVNFIIRQKMSHFVLFHKNIEAEKMRQLTWAMSNVNVCLV